MDRKKELKRLYKENPLQGGVYQIRNKQDGKILVRSSFTFNAGFNRDRMELDSRKSRFELLQAEWNRVGGDMFEFEILDVFKPRDEDTFDQRRKELLLLEQMWCEKLQPYGDRGYNILK
jgi:hypothetical protein